MLGDNKHYRRELEEEGGMNHSAIEISTAQYAMTHKYGWEYVERREVTTEIWDWMVVQIMKPEEVIG